MRIPKKNCELSREDVERITQTFLAFEETPESKIFPNQAFGYWKVTVERPLRLNSRLTLKAIESLRFASGDEEIRSALYDEFGDDLVTNFLGCVDALEKRLLEWDQADEADMGDEDAPPRKGLSEKTKKKLLDPLTWKRDSVLVDAAMDLRRDLGDGVFTDFNVFRDKAEIAFSKRDRKLSPADRKLITRAVSWREESAAPVVAKVHKPGKMTAEPLGGLFSETVAGRSAVVEYEPDSELRDTEQVPLLEEGGIEAFFRREVLPYTPDAWIKEDATKIGYEVSFTRHFYKPQPLRTLEEIRADIVAIEQEAESLLDGLLKTSIK